MTDPADKQRLDRIEKFILLRESLHACEDPLEYDTVSKQILEILEELRKPE